MNANQQEMENMDASNSSDAPSMDSLRLKKLTVEDVKRIDDMLASLDACGRFI